MDFWDYLLHADKFGAIALRMALIIVLTFAVAEALRRLFSARGSEKIYHLFLVNALAIAVYVFGGVMALNQLPGFERGFETFLAGSGIAALAISLAAQESLGNVINGIVLTVSKPFEVGDRIHLLGSDITGYVERITLRHTIMRTFVNSRVIIPNSSINKDIVENSNYGGGRASNFVDVTIPYEADRALAEQIIAKVVAEHPNAVDIRTPEQQNDPAVEVYIRALGLYGVELRASVWTENVNQNFVTCSDIRRRIKEEFDAAGIAFSRYGAAYPPTPGKGA